MVSSAGQKSTCEDLFDGGTHGQAILKRPKRTTDKFEFSRAHSTEREQVDPFVEDAVLLSKGEYGIVGDMAFLTRRKVRQAWQSKANSTNTVPVSSAKSVLRIALCGRRCSVLATVCFRPSGCKLPDAVVWLSVGGACLACAVAQTNGWQETAVSCREVQQVEQRFAHTMAKDGQ